MVQFIAISSRPGVMTCNIDFCKEDLFSIVMQNYTNLCSLTLNCLFTLLAKRFRQHRNVSLTFDLHRSSIQRNTRRKKNCEFPRCFRTRMEQNKQESSVYLVFFRGVLFHFVLCKKKFVCAHASAVLRFELSNEMCPEL